MTSHNPKLGTDAYPDSINIDDSPAGQYIQTLVIDGLGGHTDEWLLFVAVGDNIYSVDGALVADRTVDGNTNDLTFTDIGAFAVSATTVGITGTTLITGATTIEGAVVVNDTSADVDVRIESNGDANNFVSDGGLDAIGVGVLAPAGKLDVSQNSATGAKPVINVTQVDVSEEFIRFHGESAVTNANSIADAVDLPTPGAIVGWLKIYVEDTAAVGPVTDGLYWIPFYATPTV